METPVSAQQDASAGASEFELMHQVMKRENDPTTHPHAELCLQMCRSYIPTSIYHGRVDAPDFACSLGCPKTYLPTRHPRRQQCSAASRPTLSAACRFRAMRLPLEPVAAPSGGFADADATCDMDRYISDPAFVQSTIAQPTLLERFALSIEDRD